MAVRNRILNYKAILKLNGIILLIIGLSMVPALLCSLYYHEPATTAGILKSMAIIVPLGLVLFFTMRFSKTIFRAREGYIAVATCWTTAALFGMLPYFFTGMATSFSTAFFESAAGFTTTGSTVMDLSLFTKGMLMWKATSSWMGGMGILIFIISVFPALGINGQVIARLETPAPVLEKATIRMTDSARILYITYISFTILEFLLLELGSSMPTFDALANSMSTISTGGLFLHPGGLAYYDSAYVSTVICVFALVGSINFILYFNILKRNAGRRRFHRFPGTFLCRQPFRGRSGENICGRSHKQHDHRRLRIFGHDMAGIVPDDVPHPYVLRRLFRLHQRISQGHQGHLPLQIR